ncbi:MAG: hypothetical protein GPJ54_01510 [Candidatus Heimdallarchaeota archaeon]|nr:hypothetical protein [Candidatus Heimdallarchaeota archaeon]
MQDTLFIYRRRRIFKHNMIRVQTPTRIDLAGGTLDLFPLHQFVYPESFSTINVAISIYNQVSIDKLPSSNIVITSKDMELKIEFNNSNHLLAEIKKGENQLMIAMKAIYYFKIEGLKMIINSKAPKGSGLGNSSSLLIAILGGLNAYAKTNYSSEEIIDIAQGIETSILKIPTGTQDYIAAMFGGINKIQYELISQNKVELNLETILVRFQDKALLCYVEEPKRFLSTINNPNWDIFKNVVEQKDMVLENLKEINKIVATMNSSITNNDWNLFVECINKETEIRSKLSETIISSKMTELIGILSTRNIEGYKICGAGGGGCILIFSQSKEQLKNDLISMNFEILDFTIDIEGFSILN